MFAERDQDGCESRSDILTLSQRTLLDILEGASASRHSARCLLSDMSQFVAELCEYCADIAPIVPRLARRSLKFDQYPAKLLAMQRAAP
jgi:hypothetical protein